MMTDSDHQPKTTIRQLRQERGWSQRELARRLRVPPATVFRWELRGQVPTPKYQQALADLFGVPVEAIAFGPADKQP